MPERDHTELRQLVSMVNGRVRAVIIELEAYEAELVRTRDPLAAPLIAVLASIREGELAQLQEAANRLLRSL